MRWYTSRTPGRNEIIRPLAVPLTISFLDGGKCVSDNRTCARLMARRQAAEFATDGPSFQPVRHPLRERPQVLDPRREVFVEALGVDLDVLMSQDIPKAFRPQ